MKYLNASLTPTHWQACPYTGNLQSFPCAAQGETHSFYEDLEQSVA